MSSSGAWLLAALVSLQCPLVTAQGMAYPTKPVRLVGGAPGTPGDAMARTLGERLTARLGQPVIVENRPGAINTIALALVAKAEPDGHTLGILGMPSTVAPALLSTVPYDTVRDLAPVRQVSWISNLFVVRAQSSVASVADFVAAARSRPAGLTFASGGNGTPAHLAAELFKARAAIDILHVPYKGAPAGITAVISSEVDMMFATTVAVAPHVRSGRLRALATPAPERLRAFPAVPTLMELGYRELEIRDWHGIVAPAKAPKPVIARLAAEIAAALSDREVQGRLESSGFEPAVESSPEMFGALIRTELARWSRIVRDAGIRLD